MSIRKSFIAGVVLAASSIAAPSYADVCGIGTITEVREGYSNTEDLLIRLDTSTGSPMDESHLGTLTRNRFIRFKAASLSSDRLRSLRAIAYLGLVTGKQVYVWTHSADTSTVDPNKGGCSDATELAVFNEGVNPRL